ncbi:MAG: alpha/beta hydrolase family protein [Chitinophagaceae bacterium]
MRHLFSCSGLPGFFFCLFSTMLLTNNVSEAQDAKEELDDIHNWIRFSDAPNSQYYNLSAQAFKLLDKRTSFIAGLHTLTDWQQRQKMIRKTLVEIVGPFPEKAPLLPKIVKKISKDGYTMEHIVYESQPGFYVTSSLFIPDGLKQGSKAPAIIYCSGHSNDGYRNPVYQKVILNLVKKGFIVFAFDPVGQGERLEYIDPATGKSSPTGEHSISGAQAFITGGSQARYMIWDGIRAVDYLLTRNEVDAARIGITGRSGGGTQTAYIAAMDERIKVAAPENYITNFTRLIQSVGPQDAEQNLFNSIMKGIDMADFLLVRAPKPSLMITTTRDIFSIQGARETANEVKRIYKAYGKQDNFRMITDDAPHASTKKNREVMYAFFQKYLDNPGDATDEELTIPSAKELQVTATGQLSTSLKGETIFSLNGKAAERLQNKLASSRKNDPAHFSKVLESAKKLSGYRVVSQSEEPVFTGRFQRVGYTIEKYFVKGEGDYIIPYLLMIPERANHKALLYLHPSGKSAGAAIGGEMEWFVKNGFTVLAPDILGTGEMGPGKFQGDSYIKGVSYNIWFLSMLVGRSLVGILAGDVVRLSNLLKKSQGIEEVYGLARKEMVPVLLHAAAFDQAITRVAFIEPYSSYRSIVMNRLYNPAFIPGTVPAALGAYDLPDLAGSLAPRKLVIAGITDGAGTSVVPDGAKEDLPVVRDAYHQKKADDQLQIITGKSTEELDDLYKDLIK